MTIDFGVGYPTQHVVDEDGNVDPERVQRIVQRVEELGYDFVSAADHVFLPDYWGRVIGHRFLEPFTALTHAAAYTTRVRLALACLVVPYRQPFTVAKAVATLDQLSQGRFVLGIVPGYLEEEYEAFGLPLEERNQMTGEYVRIMQRLWTQQPASYDGHYYSFEDVTIWPTPRQRPHVPIWVGGSSRNAVRRAVELGTGWHPLGFTVVPEEYRHRRADELADKPLPTSGTTPERLREDLEYAQEVAASIGKEGPAIEEVVVMPGLPVPREQERVPTEQRELVQQPSTEQIVDWLGRYVEAGATGFVATTVRGATVDEYLESLQQFTETVASRVSADTGG